jgi:N-acetylglutamate synthase-like GNAT family acetyltransferase|tara:strand:- start:4995 stop:5471 length:477 start_codon:yes stop_codon:yes gene_type:complete
MIKGISVRKIQKEDIPRCGAILRRLPQWFGIEASILEYEQNLRALDGYVAERDKSIVGFVGLKRYGDFSIEIDVVGVVPDLRRSGIGRRLLEHIEEHATTASTRLLHMKTLAPSDPDKNYADTRAFWEACGYIPMDAHELWGNENPCQVMVKPFGRST